MNRYIEIIQRKAKTSRYVTKLIFTNALIFLIVGIAQLYFINKIISPFEQLNWSEVVSIALQIEPEKRYIGVEVQAVVWLYKSLSSFLGSFFFFSFYFYIKKDLEICSGIAPLLNEKTKR
jgi:hypothetical protein